MQIYPALANSLLPPLPVESVLQERFPLTNSLVNRCFSLKRDFAMGFTKPH